MVFARVGIQDVEVLNLPNHTLLALPVRQPNGQTSYIYLNGNELLHPEFFDQPHQITEYAQRGNEPSGEPWTILSSFIMENKSEEPGDSIPLYKWAISELNPGYADFWLRLGRLYLVEREESLKIKCYEKALKINPYHSRTHFYLGIHYKTQGDFQLALAHLEKAEEYSHDPEHTRRIEEYQAEVRSVLEESIIAGTDAPEALPLVMDPE